jgi:hypothetical protein
VPQIEESWREDVNEFVERRKEYLSYA